ncbi:hypothetical protein ACFWY5_29760 [Nonomuraea sp. NPDC059007]|uniref:hypothetical protein n=1 Tax=Nonomuraea sp. NPDC059007 TaxID=3346692 RepID=UPI0036B2867F
MPEPIKAMKITPKKELFPQGQSAVYEFARKCVIGQELRDSLTEDQRMLADDMAAFARVADLLITHADHERTLDEIFGIPEMRSLMALALTVASYWERNASTVSGSSYGREYADVLREYFASLPGASNG